MKILYCNVIVVGRSGTEVVTIESVTQLRRLGHDVCVYTSNAGASSRALTGQGIPVITDLDHAPWVPDIVHANHVAQSLEAAARFPSTPQIFICHDATTWHSAAPTLSLIQRWLAVDELCAERIQREISPPPDVIRLHNAVDLETFRVRAPLPAQPQAALIMAKHASHIEAVRLACSAAGPRTDAIGPAVGNETKDLPERLQGYDLVFASARMAIEAMAAGCAAIVIDGRGLAGMVTRANVAAWRQHNFGEMILTGAPTVEAIAAEIAKYNPADAREVTDFIRRDASLSDYMKRLVGIYEDAIADFRQAPVDPAVTASEIVRASLPAKKLRAAHLLRRLMSRLGLP